MIYILYPKYHTKNYGYDRLITRVITIIFNIIMKYLFYLYQKFVSHFNVPFHSVFFTASLLFHVLSKIIVSFIQSFQRLTNVFSLNISKPKLEKN